MSSDLAMLPLKLGKLGESSLFNTGKETHTLNNAEDLNTEEIDQFVASSGKVLKLRKRKNQTFENDTTAKLNNEWRTDQSYGININVLLDRIEATTPTTDQNLNSITKNKNKQSKLWVEKWRPKGFLDLVGNERNNRRILRWLRQWSPVVFKEELPKLPKEPEENIDMDPLLRPQKRILLIHGPPGIGKTSVAHVLAKQAGFSIAEINASDERAGPLVRDKINNTLFNHTFNGSPVCLVADEVDGSLEGGFIRVLLDIINNDEKATQKLTLGQNSSFIKKLKSKSKKKTQQRLLTRPIIAICNNLYSPALEKLRPLCEIVSFKRPSDKASFARET